MILWEDRTDHKDHLWCVPEYYHFFGMIANYNLYKEGGSEVRKLGDLYAEAARDLSWLRCLCLISEDIRNFADSYGEENIEIAFRKSEGECIIEFIAYFVIVYIPRNRMYIYLWHTLPLQVSMKHHHFYRNEYGTILPVVSSNLWTGHQEEC